MSLNIVGVELYNLSSIPLFFAAKLDYGSQVCCGRTRALDPIHHSRIRLATGAFLTSPVPSFLCDVEEPPLFGRRNFLSYRYVTDLVAKSKYPTYAVVINNMSDRVSESRPTAIRPLGLCTLDVLSYLYFVCCFVCQRWHPFKFYLNHLTIDSTDSTSLLPCQGSNKVRLFLKQTILYFYRWFKVR